ncbi:hypothetical protein OJAV_G00000830 [Oryzias javanicus]|uniref:UEV domain-containing protein n=1 Tax=Oryzias javanicus TaxID=123683 RepID=A0A437DLC9_ORYJA|nr:hypothetical protein OJAV_G00000830 [Oryzias javanicus]
MNWLFSASKGSGPLPLNSLQQQRQRQIESLKAAHPSVAEIQKDVEYRIPFTVNNSTISVNILLPQQFPQEKPVVSVYPPVGHHLVDSNNGTTISSPLITNFGMHSDLGKVIQSLLDEFWKSPPALMSSSSAGFPYSGLYKPAGIPPYPSQAFHTNLSTGSVPVDTPSQDLVPLPSPGPWFMGPADSVDFRSHCQFCPHVTSRSGYGSWAPSSCCPVWIDNGSATASSYWRPR